MHGLGLGATASASASASASAAASADVSSECKTAAVAFTKGATYFGLTSDTVTKTVQQCCQAVKDSNASGADRARVIAECFARAAATAGAAAACIAGGITAPFAGICGTVGSFMADRVMGYDKTQLAAGAAAGIVCGLVSGGTTSTTCFYAAAEVVGWIGDKLGPVIEGIFSPGAAAAREIARRNADNNLYFGSVESVRQAQDAVYSQWTASINRVWDLFTEAFPSGYYAMARAKLGFGNDYHSIALAFLKMGVPTTIMPQVDFAKHQKDTYPACEAFGKKVAGSYGDTSAVCPPGLVDKFYAALTVAKNSHDETQAAKQAASELVSAANLFFLQLPMAEAALASRIAVVAIAVKQQEALDQAKAASRAQLATRAVTAAGVAEAAADAALKGNAKEGKAAIQRAKNRYDMALAAYELLLDSFGKRTNAAEATVAAVACSKDASCQAAQRAVARAKAASELAVANASSATTKRYLIGAGAAAAVAGGAYLFLRK